MMKYINQDVVVNKKDGFRKVGKIVNISGEFVELLMYNQETELIPLIEISAIRIVSERDRDDRKLRFYRRA